MKTFKYLFLAVAFFSTLIASSQDNTLTKEEKKQGWKLLFDGKTTNGWHIYKAGKVGEGWRVVDGVLFLDDSKKEGNSIPNAGNIVTDGEYENYEFSVDWMISPCGNSGILFNVAETENEPWQTGPEMQIVDTCHPDAKIPKHAAGNLYDLIASSTVSVKSQTEWNTARILLNKGHLELWQNGVKQVETTMFTPEWATMIQNSKFKSYKNFGQVKKGKISLQDHNNKVSFKNIKVREIK